jgi:hypothetical protein
LQQHIARMLGARLAALLCRQAAVELVLAQAQRRFEEGLWPAVRWLDIVVSFKPNAGAIGAAAP